MAFVTAISAVAATAATLPPAQHAQHCQPPRLMVNDAEGFVFYHRLCIHASCTGHHQILTFPKLRCPHQRLYQCHQQTRHHGQTSICCPRCNAQIDASENRLVPHPTSAMFCGNGVFFGGSWWRSLRRCGRVQALLETMHLHIPACETQTHPTHPDSP